MITPDDAFKKSEEIVVSREQLTKKVGDITVGELLALMRLAQRKRKVNVTRGDNIKYKIIEAIENGDRVTAYSVAKELQEEYGVVLYHINSLAIKGVIEKDPFVNENKQRGYYLRVVNNGKCDFDDDE